MQHVQCLLLFLVQAVNSARFKQKHTLTQVARSYALLSHYLLSYYLVSLYYVVTQQRDNGQTKIFLF